MAKPHRSGPFAAPAWAHQQRLGNVGMKSTLQLLAAYADEAYSCFPGQERIAEETEQSVSTVYRQMVVMREAGLLRVEPRTDPQTGNRLSDRIYLQLDVTVTAEDIKAAKTRITSRSADGADGEKSDGQPVNLTGDQPVNLTGGEPGQTGGPTGHQVTGDQPVKRSPPNRSPGDR